MKIRDSNNKAHFAIYPFVQKESTKSTKGYWISNLNAEGEGGFFDADKIVWMFRKFYNDNF